MALVNLPVERAPVVGGPSASGLDRDTTDKGGGKLFPPPLSGVSRPRPDAESPPTTRARSAGALTSAIPHQVAATLSSW